jgi:multidrug efflux pump subunit AcrB
MNSADISANLAPGYDLGTVVKHLNAQLDTDLNSSETYSYSGRIVAFLQSKGEMLSLFGLSLIFIYLVLAAQFESFVDPLVILLTVPLCIVGAIATLWAVGGSLNLFTDIGLVTLVGLVTKHGILITQFANTKLLEGEKLVDAICDAAVVRLRPILMTTFAMILGALPLALETGPGSVSHSQIGWVIVGGMFFGTFFSLVVVPVAYYFLARFDHKKKRLIGLA